MNENLSSCVHDIENKFFKTIIDLRYIVMLSAFGCEVYYDNKKHEIDP